MSQLNRTCTLNKSFRVADVFEILNKSLEENTTMIQRKNNVIVKCKLLGTRKLGIMIITSQDYKLIYEDINIYDKIPS